MDKNIKISGKILSRYDKIVTGEALKFVQEIHEQFNSTRLELLNERKKSQKAIDNGHKLDFLNETKKIRDADWKIKNIPRDLLKRQVEITGPPVPKKMLISALNSGADCYMTDFEDSLTPNFDNLIQGQLNIKDAINKKIDFFDKKSGKEYKLNQNYNVHMDKNISAYYTEDEVIFEDGSPLEVTKVDKGEDFINIFICLNVIYMFLTIC